jgi:hypothetical protein
VQEAASRQQNLPLDLSAAGEELRDALLEGDSQRALELAQGLRGRCRSVRVLRSLLNSIASRSCSIAALAARSSALQPGAAFMHTISTASIWQHRHAGPLPTCSIVACRRTQVCWT